MDIIVFDAKHAEEFGLHEAILIAHFITEIRYKKKTNENVKNGRVWVRSSLNTLAKKIPCFSPKQLERIINSLINQNVIIKEFFNEHNFDRTCWYSFRDDKKFLR